MLKNGRGVLCAPITEERCQELELDMQVANNTSLLGTPFTITVDKLGGGCTTGVSMVRYHWRMQFHYRIRWKDRESFLPGQTERYFCLTEIKRIVQFLQHH